VDPTYQNPKIPEGINAKPGHPLREFLSLLIVVSTVFATIVLILSLLASQLAAKIPFQYERDLVERFEFFEKTTTSPQQDWLQRLVDDLVVAAKLPADMEITVHYVDDDLVNAMATLGGHIFVFRGLIEALPSENALAMVIAHEIAHVQHRHPLLALGRATTVGIGLAAVSGIAGADVSNILLDNVKLLTQLSYSRDQEREADASGLNTLVSHYGHASDADALFQHFARQDQDDAGMNDESLISMPEISLPDIFQTHPDPEARVSYIQEIIRQRALDGGPIRPIPDIFSSPHPDSE